jgi:hypothetical protein
VASKYSQKTCRCFFLELYYTIYNLESIVHNIRVEVAAAQGTTFGCAFEKEKTKSGFHAYFCLELEGITKKAPAELVSRTICSWETRV